MIRGPKKDMPHSDYLVALQPVPRGLEAAATRDAVFEKRGTRWVATGRLGAEAPVRRLKGPGWTGLKAEVVAGITDGTGFHGAAGNALWAVVSNGKRSVVADTQGIVGNDRVTMKTIHSIRFPK